jgi:hypothetical protein
MSTAIGRALLFLIVVTLTARDHIPQVDGLYDSVYYNTMHKGCANTPYAGNPSGFLCPPLPSDGAKYFNGIFFPPGPYSRNGCLVNHGPQPDVEIDPVSSNWTYYYGCRFADVMAIADVVAGEGGYTKLSDHTPTGEYCPLWVVEAAYGHCTGTPQ